MTGIVLIFLVVGLVLFVSLCGRSEAQARIDDRRQWRVRNEGGVFVYEQKSADGWLSIKLESIQSEESYGIYGIRIWREPEWSSRVPDWARGMRNEIASRVKEAFPSVRILK